MSEFDDFDDIVNDLMKMAGRILSSGGAGTISQRAPQKEAESADEVIDGKDRLTYVLDAPGRDEADFKVDVRKKEIGVTGPGIEVRRELPSAVDPKSAVVKYLNGTLSVSASKA